MYEENANIWEKDKTNSQSAAHHRQSDTHSGIQVSPLCLPHEVLQTVLPSAHYSLLGQKVTARGGSVQYIHSDLMWPSSHPCSGIFGNKKCSMSGYSQINDGTGQWDTATLESWGKYEVQCCTIHKKQLLDKMTQFGDICQVCFSSLRRRLYFSWKNLREYARKIVDLQLLQVKEIKNPRIASIPAMSGERTTSLAASLYSVSGLLSHLWSLSVISLVLNTYPVCPEIWNLSLLMIFFLCHASKILRQTKESRPICGLLFLPGLSVRPKSCDHTAQLFSEPLLVSASLSSLPSLI